VLTIPKAPYRCPPGPYERASLVAAYFKRHKPRSKVIVLDGNPGIVSKKGLFLTAWKELYPGIIDYRPNNALVDVDVRGRRVITEFETVSAGVINVVPPQHAGRIARIAGVVNSEDRWVRVNHLSYESTAVPGIHVIGDATTSTPAPKSGHVANQQGKVTAAAVADLLAGRALHADPALSNTCYSFVSNEEAINVAAVYRVDSGGATLKLAEGSSGVSDARSALEAEFARAWAANIWADMLG
jgi:NADPH-dependent 2,4-dienoyl-CoA reductase/sulfur reductase-like enzyme